MVPKVSRGVRMRGLVFYLYGLGESNEHLDQRALAASDGIEVGFNRMLDREEVADLADQLEIPKRLYGCGKDERTVWRMSLSNSTRDRRLSDGEWAEAARVAMRDLGFDDGVGAPAPWVAVRHGLSSGGNDHVHIAVSLVREDGRRASVHNDYRKASKLAVKLEKRFGLEAVAGRTAGAAPVPTRGEVAKAERLGRAEPDRRCLARKVRAAAGESLNEAEFVRRLKGNDVLVKPFLGEGDQVSGYSVAVSPSEGETPIFFGGGKLSKDLTLPKLRRQWEPIDDQQKVWKDGSGVDVKLREHVVIPETAWKEAADRVAAATAQFKACGSENVSEIGAVAADASAVFAALAERFETEKPGPLAATAATLADTAQISPAQNQARGKLDGVAVVAAQAVIHRGRLANETVSWFLLLAQLQQLAKAVQELHDARQEKTRANDLGANQNQVNIAAQKTIQAVPAERSKGLESQNLPLPGRGAKDRDLEL